MTIFLLTPNINIMYRRKVSVKYSRFHLQINFKVMVVISKNKSYGWHKVKSRDVSKFIDVADSKFVV